jgi:hypothetical protein
VSITTGGRAAKVTASIALTLSLAATVPAAHALLDDVHLDHICNNETSQGDNDFSILIGNILAPAEGLLQSEGAQVASTEIGGNEANTKACSPLSDNAVDLIGGDVNVLNEGVNLFSGNGGDGTGGLCVPIVLQLLGGESSNCHDILNIFGGGLGL